jgi:hypothetical protein
MGDIAMVYVYEGRTVLVKIALGWISESALRTEVVTIP